jgi:hypothetical protein
MDETEGGTSSGSDQGGMSSGSGQGGFSTAGTVPTSSSGSEPAPPQPLGFDPEGAVFGPVPIPQSVQHLMETIVEAVHGLETQGWAHPIIIIPRVLKPEHHPDA